MLMVYVISLIIHQEGWQISWEYLRNKLLIIGFPLAFCLVRYRGKSVDNVYLWVFVGFVHFIAFGGVYNYVFHFREDLAGQNVLHEAYIPFVMHHHMLSLIVNTSILLVADFYFKDKSSLTIWQIVGIALLILVDIALIFVIGARVGLLILVLSTLVILLFKFKNAKSLLLPIVLCSILIFTFFYNFSASVNARMQNTFTEIKYIINSYHKDSSKVEHIGNFTARIISCEDNFKLIKKNFWTGIGLVRFDETLVRHFDTVYAKDDYAHRQFPPNTWLRYALSMGVPLIVLFLLFFLSPLFFDSNFMNMLVLSSFICLFIYSNSEAPLEYTMPFRFYIVYLCLVCRVKYTIAVDKN
jgi:ABC-type multidrug transport system fused ATPase/permease subunit